VNTNTNYKKDFFEEALAKYLLDVTLIKRAHFVCTLPLTFLVTTSKVVKSFQFTGYDIVKNVLILSPKIMRLCSIVRYEIFLCIFLLNDLKISLFGERSTFERCTLGHHLMKRIFP
jgi:hypothetical protein